MRLTRALTAAALMLAAPIARAIAEEPPIYASTLARCVPTDAQLFFELRNMSGFTATRAGSLFSMLVTNLVLQPTPTTKPAKGWRGMIASAIGLQDKETVNLLFSGRVALAADNWSGLGEAIILAEPSDVAAFEQRIASRLISSAAEQPVRLYRLASQQELACNGEFVVLGRRGAATSLYARTVELMGKPDRIAMSNLAAFRDRTGSLSPETQVLFYASGAERGDHRGVLTGGWWMETWPDVISLGLGLIVTDDGLILDVSGELNEPLPIDTERELPMHGFLRLPADTIAAWTQSIDYLDWHRHLASSSGEKVAALLKALTQGMDAADIDRRLLRRLRGDTIFVVGQARLPLEETPTTGPALHLPAVALAVETDAPHLVDDTLRRISDNLLTLLNNDPLPGEPIRLEEKPLPGGIGSIHSVSLARMMPQDIETDLVDWAQFSWTIVDRWVVIASHPELVEQLVAARQSGVDVLPTGAVVEALQRAETHGGNPRRVLVAQPHLASKSIGALIGLLAERHPEMLDAKWWNALRRKRRAAGVQLGVIPAANEDGRVVVRETLPNYPADRRLLADDHIMAVDSQALDAEHPRQSLRQLVASRQDPTTVTLTVLRDDKTVDVEIAMPDIPSAGQGVPAVQLLQQASAILQFFHSASFASWQPAPNVIQARLELHFSKLK